MSETPRRGPLMLVATNALKPPPLRVGRIGGNITLPRTVPVASLLSGGVGGLIALVVFSIVFGMSVRIIMYSVVFGALAGIAVVSYSPLKGESLTKWIMLKLKNQRLITTVGGTPVRVAVGICYVPEAHIGRIGIKAGGVTVRAGMVDERGVAVSVGSSQGRWLRTESGDEAGTPVALPPGLQRLPSDAQLARDRKPMSSIDAHRAKQRAAQEEIGGIEGVDATERTAGHRHGRWIQDSTQLKDLYDAGGDES